MIYKCKPKRVSLYHNYGRKTAEQIKSEQGCQYVFNASLFNLNSMHIYCPTKIDRAWFGQDGYIYVGYGWPAGDQPQVMTSKEAERADISDFVSCIWAIENGKALELRYNADMGGVRGRTGFGFTADGTMVILCTSDAAGAMTLEAARDTLIAQGCISGILLDGGGSSQCAADKNSVYSSRIVPVLVCVRTEEKEENGVDKKYKVCLDPGHGTGELNCSPDKRYYEYKFAWDISNRVKALLESTERFEVLLTKDSAEATPSLSERAEKANTWGADILVSEHSNAVSGGWNDSVSGATVWIYALGGNRERLAMRLLDQFDELDVELFGSKLYTAKFAVLARTNMPAALIENYFHTCRGDVGKLLDDAEIDKLAYAQARGICEYFNMSDELIPLPEPEKEIDVLKDIIYRVQVGAFAVEDNAKAMAAALKGQGYETIMKEEKR